ncbi:ferritin-like domain-containing protein [Paenibacillus donghaensis]|uniref:Rubrerythrin family protein n=1 Tax=Paenibacillus donghaensis TaxID=414771 RepID=A0A2Z2K669_9BACL|nr:ferritin-like domain-containing protein [Paenibacillus donghaensis]ASA20207.1 rubrerythrin family protein [Paenibacillus donghaensis]
MYSGYYYAPAPMQVNWAFQRSDDAVVQMIQQSIQGERNDEVFYDFLIKLAPTLQEQEVITGIRNDERKHRQMFRTLYTQLTGRAPSVAEEPAELLPDSYIPGLEQALLGELKAFEKYRKIYLHINPQYRDWIFEIMTDEIKHASYYNWLYAKNK